MDNLIATTAEAHESTALPRIHEVRTEPGQTPACEATLPAALRKPSEDKSPARWAYERLIHYIGNFEQTLDKSQEVAMGFAGGDAGVLRIEGLGYFDPDMITFYGRDDSGARTQLIQHVTQLGVMLRAVPRPSGDTATRRIGFQLVQDLEGASPTAPDATA